MTIQQLRAPLFGLALSISPTVHAQEEDPNIAGLQTAATTFVEAYNNKDAASLAKLFTPNGEICSSTGEDLISGRDQIQAYYEDAFADAETASIALEVISVRIVGDGLAVEDGIIHATMPGDQGAPVSNEYSAVLSRNDQGTWLIASTRVQRDVTDAAGQLAGLADVLNGEWYGMNDTVRTELALGWHASGKFLVGDFVVRTSDAPSQTGKMRVGWDPAKQSIVSWMFDSAGGAIQGIWTPTEEGWIVRSEGTTGDGETMSAIQELNSEDSNAFVWSSSKRIIGGALAPDGELRFARRAPEPATN